MVTFYDKPNIGKNIPYKYAATGDKLRSYFEGLQKLKKGTPVDLILFTEEYPNGSHLVDYETFLELNQEGRAIRWREYSEKMKSLSEPLTLREKILYFEAQVHLLDIKHKGLQEALRGARLFKRWGLDPEICFAEKIENGMTIHQAKREQTLLYLRRTKYLTYLEDLRADPQCGYPGIEYLQAVQNFDDLLDDEPMGNA